MSTATQDQHISKFLAYFAQFEQGLNGHKAAPWHQQRQKAAGTLAEARFPTRRDEDWKYTPVTRILNTDFEDASTYELSPAALENYLINKENLRLVFLNGRFSASLSHLEGLPQGMTIQKLGAAYEQELYRELIDRYFSEPFPTEVNPFVDMNTALSADGFFIHLDTNCVSDRTLEVLYLNQSDRPFFAHPQLLIVAQTSSKLDMVERFAATDANQAAYLTNVANRIVLHPNAQINHYKLQEEGTEAYQINNTLVLQERDSTYSNYSLDLGGRIVRNNLSTIHRGENLLSNLYGAFMVNGNQHIDNQTFIDHAIPNCQSNELYKGILDDKARGVFNGKVMVRQDAQKTNAYQQNSSLVLSDSAVMDSKPQLEIFADDVRCSHGATIGQLDEASVFYLRSRGMNEQQARNTLQHAFLLDVLERMPDETIREIATGMIEKKF